MKFIKKYKFILILFIIAGVIAAGLSYNPAQQPAKTVVEVTPSPSPVTVYETPEVSASVTETPAPTAIPPSTPLPSPLPAPVVPTPEETITCTLLIRCNTVLNNRSVLNPEKAELIPSDGVIYPETVIEFSSGESVFDVLLRETKRTKIHLEFTKAPLYGSTYIEGIGNLYEFDCGELSGWMYKVNDKFPHYGCSNYKLKPGDKIEWVYTCNLGKDIGGENISQNQ